MWRFGNPGGHVWVQDLGVEGGLGVQVDPGGVGRRGPHPRFILRPILGPIHSYLNYQFANNKNAGEALGPRILVGAEVGPSMVLKKALPPQF